MSPDTDQLNRGQDARPRLEDILAEFSPPDEGGHFTAPPERETPPRRQNAPPEKAAAPAKRTAAPVSPAAEADNVVDFPAPDKSVTARLGRLLQRADAYAEHMFEAEETDEEAERAARLLPGVDREREAAPRRRRIRPLRELPPDLPPAELSTRAARGLKLLWVRVLLAGLFSALLLYLTAAVPLALPFGAALAAAPEAAAYLCAALLGGTMLLSLDLLGAGIGAFVRLRLTWDTLAALAALATLADALTMPRLGLREGQLPFCAASSVILTFGLLARFHARRGLRHSARAAAAAKDPYAVTLDPDKWDHRDAFTKHLRGTEGYGSQLQTDDGAARLYHIAAPLLLIACMVFSLLASAGAGHPERTVWCLSATLCAAAGLGGGLTFALPFSLLARRLSKSGVALGGWDGIRDATRAVGVVLTDADLFPRGAVSLNGIKIIGDFDLLDVVSCTATLIRASGSGLAPLFHDLVRTQGATYRRCDGVTTYEVGYEAMLQRRRVIVGTAAFLGLMDVDLPEGLAVKNAVFCAIDGALAGIFVLNYALHSAVRPALGALLQNRLPPILATRDPTVCPDMLRRRFKLPVERMEYPEVARRRDLSAPAQEHGAYFAAVLCREGVAPYAEAVVAGRRLVTAVRWGGGLSLFGAAVGILLCFYLTHAGAFLSLSALNFALFLGMWSLPVLLLAGWVNRY